METKSNSFDLAVGIFVVVLLIFIAFVAGSKWGFKVSQIGATNTAVLEECRQIHKFFADCKLVERRGLYQSVLLCDKEAVLFVEDYTIRGRFSIPPNTVPLDVLRKFNTSETP